MVENVVRDVDENVRDTDCLDCKVVDNLRVVDCLDHKVDENLRDVDMNFPEFPDCKVDVMFQNLCLN